MILVNNICSLRALTFRIILDFCHSITLKLTRAKKKKKNRKKSGIDKFHFNVQYIFSSEIERKKVKIGKLKCYVCFYSLQNSKLKNSGGLYSAGLNGL